MSAGLLRAYGGVVIDDRGRVLLREPANHYDGYVWTFPKGRCDPGETPEQTACREVKEETGCNVQIVSKLPGSYPGGVTRTEYFLMQPAGPLGEFDPAETASVRWTTFEEARQLIGKTLNAIGRARDLQVLTSAERELNATS